MAAHKWWSTIAIQEVYSKIYMATRINSVSVAEALHVEEEASGISATQAELVGGVALQPEREDVLTVFIVSYRAQV